MANEAGFEYDVFISYRRVEPDRGWVGRELFPKLKLAGLHVCWDDASFPYGVSLIDEMSRASAQSRHVLCIVSPDYFAGSGMAEWESKLAQLRDPAGQDRVLIPFMLRETPDAPARIRILTAVDWTRSEDRQWQWRKLLEELGASNVEVPPPDHVQGPDVPQRTRDAFKLVHRQTLDAMGNELFSVAFSRDDRFVACGSEKQVLLWDRDRDETPRVLGGHQGFVYSVAFSDAGDLIAGGGEHGVVQVWDVQSGEQRWGKKAHKEAIYSVAFSRDDSLLASGSYDKDVILWDAKTGTRRRRCTLPPGGRVNSVAFSPREAMLAVGRLDDTVTLWSIQTGSSHPMNKPEPHWSSVETVAFSPDGRYLASGGLDKYVILWDVDSKEAKWRGREHEYLVRSVAFSPDGTTLASASWDKTVKLWDVTTGEVVQELPVEDNDPRWHTDWIWSVTFSPKEMLLATGGSDGKLILWSVRTG